MGNRPTYSTTYFSSSAPTLGVKAGHVGGRPFAGLAFVLELMVSQDGGGPLVSQNWDGNASEQLSRSLLPVLHNRSQYSICHDLIA